METIKHAHSTTTSPQTKTTSAFTQMEVAYKVTKARQQYSQSDNGTDSAYMGPETASTVYAAELQGICMALEMVQAGLHQWHKYKHIHIFANNQAAIRFVVRPEGRSEGYITKQIVQKTDELMTEGLSVDIYWVRVTRASMAMRPPTRLARRVNLGA